MWFPCSGPTYRATPSFVPWDIARRKKPRWIADSLRRRTANLTNGVRSESRGSSVQGWTDTDRRRDGSQMLSAILFPNVLADRSGVDGQYLNAVFWVKK